MLESMNWPFAGLLALGAFHGVNPGMGWLFAVALGLQERRRAAVCRAMLPLALGHALAIAAAVAVAMLAGAVVPLRLIATTRSYRRPTGNSEAANASVSPRPAASRNAATALAT